MLNLLHHHARAAWDAHPFLASAYADFQAFAENFDAVRRESDSHAAITEWLRSSHVGAVTRLNNASYPLSGKKPCSSAAVTRRGDRLTLWLYGPVAPIADELLTGLRNNKDAKGIIVRIDSPGGVVDLALQLSGELRRHRARKLAIIDRACWSAAVLVASACNKIYARPGATVMIHRSRLIATGNAQAISDVAARLRAIDTMYLHAITRNRRRLRTNAVRDLHFQERFLSAQEAVEYGFVDRIIHPLQSFATASSSFVESLSPPI